MPAKANSWNAFQKANKGRWSQKDMKRQYQTWQAAGCPDLAAWAPAGGGSMGEDQENMQPSNLSSDDRRPAASQPPHAPSSCRPAAGPEAAEAASGQGADASSAAAATVPLDTQGRDEQLPGSHGQPWALDARPLRTAQSTSSGATTANSGNGASSSSGACHGQAECHGASTSSQPLPPLLTWNQFQARYKGLGWRQRYMSSMWQQYKATGQLPDVCVPTSPVGPGVQTYLGSYVRPQPMQQQQQQQEEEEEEEEDADEPQEEAVVMVEQTKPGQLGQPKQEIQQQQQCTQPDPPKQPSLGSRLQLSWNQFQAYCRQVGLRLRQREMSEQYAQYKVTRQLPLAVQPSDSAGAGVCVSGGMDATWVSSSSSVALQARTRAGSSAAAMAAAAAGAVAPPTNQGRSQPAAAAAPSAGEAAVLTSTRPRRSAGARLRSAAAGFFGRAAASARRSSRRLLRRQKLPPPAAASQLLGGSVRGRTGGGTPLRGRGVTPVRAAAGTPVRGRPLSRCSSGTPHKLRSPLRAALAAGPSSSRGVHMASRGPLSSPPYATRASSRGRGVVCVSPSPSRRHSSSSSRTVQVLLTHPRGSRSASSSTAAPALFTPPRSSRGNAACVGPLQRAPGSSSRRPEVPHLVHSSSSGALDSLPDQGSPCAARVPSTMRRLDFGPPADGLPQQPQTQDMDCVRGTAASLEQQQQQGMMRRVSSRAQRQQERPQQQQQQQQQQRQWEGAQAELCQQLQQEREQQQQHVACEPGGMMTRMRQRAAAAAAHALPAWARQHLQQQQQQQQYCPATPHYHLPPVAYQPAAHQAWPAPICSPAAAAAAAAGVRAVPVTPMRAAGLSRAVAAAAAAGLHNVPRGRGGRLLREHLPHTLPGLLEGWSEWHLVDPKALKQIKQLVPQHPGVYEWGCGLASEVQEKVEAAEQRRAAAAATAAAAAAGEGRAHGSAAAGSSSCSGREAKPNPWAGRLRSSTQQPRIVCFYLGKSGTLAKRGETLARRFARYAFTRQQLVGPVKEPAKFRTWQGLQAAGHPLYIRWKVATDEDPALMEARLLEVIDYPVNVVKNMH